MYKIISYISSVMLSKYSSSRNRYFRLQKNGSYSIESFLEETDQKSFNTESTTILTKICFEKN